MYRRGHNEAVSKTVSQIKLARGFESHRLRHKTNEQIFLLEEIVRNISEKTKDKLKLSFALGSLLIILICVCIIIINYQVQGEKNMPYKLSKITVISTAEGVQNEDAEENAKWNLNVYQNNDIYFFIDKANEDVTETIERVTISNIKVIAFPEVGEIETYMPSSEDGRTFQTKSEYLVGDSLTYEGGASSSSKELTIGNKGGSMVFRLSNTKIGRYVSAEGDEIKHDGSLITKLGYTEKNIAFDINFDLVIEIEGIKYKTNISLSLPCDGLCEYGTSSKEITNTGDIIFKRTR